MEGRMGIVPPPMPPWRSKGYLIHLLDVGYPTWWYAGDSPWLRFSGASWVFGTDINLWLPWLGVPQE